MDDRGRLSTERTHPASEDLDLLGAGAFLDAMLGAEDEARRAVRAARDEIVALAEAAASALAGGGRMVHVGAGTSGRLGVMDAAECPPTFGSSPDQVVGIIAGGEGALRRSVEGAEDSSHDGGAAMDAVEAGPGDLVLGISAGGTTSFVAGALGRARERGATTAWLCCLEPGEAEVPCDHAVHLATGPEVLAGSTRLKAGSATKIVLNFLSTYAMARLGKIHGSLMVDVDTGSNSKLVSRGARIVAALTGLEEPEAAEILAAARGRAKTAVVMHANRCTASEAEKLLEASGGHLRSALPDSGLEEV